jgi:low affinity Fe/Cu permease
MESAADIKNSLIQKIQKSSDIKLLKALQSLFESKEEEVFTLNKEQEKAIEESRKQIQNGEVISNEDVLSEAREWLSKK